MYKKQVKIQKLLCVMAIIVSAAVFIYSLGIITDIYDTLYSTMRNPNDLTKTSVAGSFLYYEMQGFNQSFMLYGLAMILLSVGLFLTNTHTRRKYYIGNYVSVGLWSVAAVGGSVWSHFQIEAIKAKWLQIDFEALQKHAQTFKSLYTESTFWLDLHYLICALLLLVTVLMVCNLVWKQKLMREETALLAKG